MLILVGCEKSQRVTMALRKKGHEAFSCDLQECTGGYPEFHLKMNVMDAIKLKPWDMGIFFPDCTFLTVSGLFRNKNNPERAAKTERALEFVRDLMNCGIKKIAIENPVGCISTRIFWYMGGENGPARWEVFPRPLKHGARKPNQIIQPYHFGEDASKSTCLWLTGLPKLKSTGYFPPRIIGGKKRWSNQTDSGQNKLGPDKKTEKGKRAELRSITYQGIADAMADQWG